MQNLRHRLCLMGSICTYFIGVPYEEHIKRGEMTRYLLYITRWAVLAIPGALFFNWFIDITQIQNVYIAMLISQAFLGCIVYFIDKYIFRDNWFEVWENKQGVCNKCGKEDNLRRLVMTEKYDRRKDTNPSFLCPICSGEKTKELEEKGIVVKFKI